jgi:hypothetical protein
MRYAVFIGKPVDFRMGWLCQAACQQGSKDKRMQDEFLDHVWLAKEQSNPGLLSLP